MAAPMSNQLSKKCFRACARMKTLCHQISSTFSHSIKNQQSEKPTPLAYCTNLVKKCDYENFLCTLLYDKQCQAAALALRAFYIELAQVPDVTTDHMRALLRFQFWKDSLNATFEGKPPQAPILLELSQHIQKNRLSKAWLTRILDERVKQTETDKFRSLKDVEDAAENTVTCLNYLLLQTKGIADLNADHAASHLGRCQGLVTHLRGVRYHATRGKVYLPIELIIKHKVSQEQVLRQKDDASLRDLAYEVASQAHIHLEKARGFKNKVPRDAYPFFLNSVICEKYLKDLQLANFNIFHESLYLSPTKQRLAWRLLVQKYLKRTY